MTQEMPKEIWAANSAWNLDNESTAAFRKERIGCTRYIQSDIADELLEALEEARKVIDELMPGIANIACDIGLINDGGVKVNRAIAKAKG